MTTKSRWDEFNYIDYLDVKNKEITNLPKGVSISTISATCKLLTRLDLENIKKYLKLSPDDIITVKQNNDNIRTLLEIKTKPKRNVKNEKPKEVNHFYNQISVVVRINHNECDFSDEKNIPRINLKLFKNGSVQMSGCKKLSDINIVLNKLITRLKEVKGKIENDTIVEKTFIDNPDIIGVSDFKFAMINSNYKVKMQIDRDKLYSLLKKKKIQATFEPCIRACVIVKYTPSMENIDSRDISIFIFQKGNIIITGAKAGSHIIASYNYINNIIEVHASEIYKRTEQEDENEIMKYYNLIKEEESVSTINI